MKSSHTVRASNENVSDRLKEIGLVEFLSRQPEDSPVYRQLKQFQNGYLLRVDNEGPNVMRIRTYPPKP